MGEPILDRLLLLHGNLIGPALTRREDTLVHGRHPARGHRRAQPSGARATDEATRLICECGFFFRSPHNIKVEINGYNQRAMRLYERLGFRPRGPVREALLLNGNRCDQVVMDLLRSEFDLKHVGAVPRACRRPAIVTAARRHISVVPRRYNSWVATPATRRRRRCNEASQPSASSIAIWTDVGGYR